ncbi:MAG: ATP-dependent Clp protease proteolytic subunit [Candidatus Falkowbacteria bacterium]|nr:ATP-dependent Clp protease proteolytic subunit [Candidatus Falkowbacteria bacterium]
MNFIKVYRRIDKDVEIILNSTGGETFIAIGFFNFVRTTNDLRKHITMIASGQVASAANVIYATAEKRVSIPNTIFIIHGSSNMVANNVTTQALAYAKSLFT